MPEIESIKREDFHKNHLLKRLLNIVPPREIPKEIFYKGKFPGKEFKFLAVVGSRNISPYGKEATKKLLSELAGYPICIISGLAIGADTCGHKNALQNNLPTIAVPGSTINEDEIYPGINKKLATEILENDGLLISEYKNKSEVGGPWVFPARNRIMAALADAVLLIEASEKSGTLITARLATDYNKELLCLPGEIFSENSKGTNRLISEGARIVLSGSDILHSLKIKEKDNSLSLKFILNEDEQKIVENLLTPISKDSLFEKVGGDFSNFLMSLTMLEMKGIIAEEFGQIRKILN